MNTPGHALRNDGKPFRMAKGKWVVWLKDRIGHGLCYCGQASPVVTTRAARIAWHKDHTAEVRGEAVAKKGRSHDEVVKILEMDLITAKIRNDARLGQDVIMLPYSELIRLIGLCAVPYALTTEDTMEAFELYLERTQRLGGLSATVEASNVSGRV